MEDQLNSLGYNHISNAWMPAVPHSTGLYMITAPDQSSNQYGSSYYKNVILKNNSFVDVEINLGTNGDGADNYTPGNSYKFRFVVEEISN